MDEPVLFVVGSGRAGTTLLYELVCCHPSAAWVSNYSQRLLFLGRFHPRVPTSFKGRSASRWVPRPVEGYRLFDRVRPPDTPSVHPDLAGRLVAEDLSSRERHELRSAVAAHLKPRAKRFFVNKNTRNTRRVGYLDAAFPEARFVHVVRHPIPAASSLARVAFFSGLPAFWRGGALIQSLVDDGEMPEVLAAELWTHETAMCQEALRAMRGDRQLVVRYEDLSERPLDVLEDVMALIGQAVSPSMRSEVVARQIANRNAPALAAMPPDVRSAVWQAAGAVADVYGYRAV